MVSDGDSEAGTSTVTSTSPLHPAIRPSCTADLRLGGLVILGREPEVELPTYGHVFKVRGDIQIQTDKKYNRRAVVVGVPRDLDGRVRIVTRTSDEDRKGVPSPKDPELGFDLPGVWAYYRSVEARLWLPPAVTYVGVLDPEIVKQICKHFGIRGTVS